MIKIKKKTSLVAKINQQVKDNEKIQIRNSSLSEIVSKYEKTMIANEKKVTIKLKDLKIIKTSLC